MRCPNCAGEIHDQSRFCGICGRGVDVPANLPPREWDSQTSGARSSLSLFELPVSPRARAVRLGIVLTLDALLIGVGVAMMLSYAAARDRARTDSGSHAEADASSPRSEVEILAPTFEPEEPDEAAEIGESARADAPNTRARSQPASSTRSRPTADPSPTSPSLEETGSGEPSGETRPSTEPGPAQPDTAATPSTPSTPTTPMSEAEMEMLTRNVAGVVNSHRAQFERCSRQVAKGAGPVQGNVVIRFAISSDGRPTNVRATTNTTGSERLAACVVAQFESWTFPQHRGAKPLSFLWPLVFKAP